VNTQEALKSLAISGEFDALYSAMCRGDVVGQIVSAMYNDIVIDHNLHADDDVEEILGIVAERLEDEFGV
jgi:hypothetical protein